jgi:hypothetical protein
VPRYVLELFVLVRNIVMHLFDFRRNELSELITEPALVVVPFDHGRDHGSASTHGVHNFGIQLVQLRIVTAFVQSTKF